MANDVLNQLLQFAASSELERQNQVSIHAQTAERKRIEVAEDARIKQIEAASKSLKPVNSNTGYNAAISNFTGYGQDSATPEEQAVSGSFVDNYLKYGVDKALELSAAKTQGKQRYLAESNVPIGAPDTIKDNAIDVVRGLANMTGAIANLPIAMVSSDAGVALSQYLERTNKEVDASQSSGLNRTKQHLANVKSLANRDGQAAYEADTSPYKDTLVARLGREGKNALNSLAIDSSNGAALASIAAQGVGSVLPIGVVAGSLSRAAQVAAPFMRGGAAIASAVEGAQVPITVGIAGGGSAYQGAVNKIMETPFEVLAEKSPEFLSLVQGGATPDEARKYLADKAGKKAAPLAIAASAALAKFAPEFETIKSSRMPSLGSALKGIAKETPEESLENSSGVLASNTGVQQVIPSQDVLEGTGAAFGEGAIGGFATSGVLSTPSLAKGAVTSTASAAVSGVTAVLDKAVSYADKKLAKNEEASPVSDKNLTKASTALNAVAVDSAAIVKEAAQATTLADTQKAQIEELANALSTVHTVDTAGLAALNPEIGKATKDSKSKFEVFQALEKVVTSEDSSIEAKNIAAKLFFSEYGGMEGFLNDNKDIVDLLPEDHPGKKIVNQFKQVTQNILSSPTFQKSVNKVMEHLVKQQDEGKLVPVTEQNIATPEAAQSIAATTAIAAHAPEKADKVAVEDLLKHAANGKITLTPKQKLDLQLAKAVLDTSTTLAPDGEALNGLLRVGNEATKNEDMQGSKGLSAIQHARTVVNAIREGDQKQAKEALRNFKAFALHYQRKVAALNEALGPNGGVGKKIPYKKLSNGKWVDGTITLQAKGSGVDFAVSVLREGQAIGKMFNAMVETFPELAGKALTLTDPDPMFMENGELDVLAAKRAIEQFVKKEPTKQTTPATTKQVTPTEQPAPPVEAAKQPVEATKPVADTSTTSEETAAPKAQEKAADSHSSVGSTETKPASPEQTKTEAVSAESTNLTDFVNHSGGANGADSYWGDVGEAYGVKSNHYYKDKTPKGNVQITKEQFEEGLIKAKEAAKALGRNWSNNSYVQGLLSRNWQQVKNADAIFAIGTINGKYVDGGTGYAIAMAVIEGKPIYVFDQNKNNWYERTSTGWKKITTPTLTPNFAGIGSRNLTDLGKQAIEDVYAKTASVFNNKVDNTKAEAFTEKLSTTKQTKDEVKDTPVVDDKTRVKELEAKYEALTTAEINELAALKAKLGTLTTKFGLYELLNTSGNLFVAGFKWMTNAEKSNLLAGDDNPLILLEGLLDSAAKTDAEKAVTSAVYKFVTRHVNVVGDYVIAKMQASLAKSNNLAKTISVNPVDDLNKEKGSKTIPARFRNNKLYSLFTPVYNNGNFGLNLEPNLLEQALIASVQWMFTAKDRQAIVDETSVASLLNVSLEEAALYVDALQGKMSMREATTMLARDIERYWGVKRKSNMPAGSHEGISKAMAAEILLAMEKDGKIIISMEEGGPHPVQVVEIVTPEANDPVWLNPTILDDVTQNKEEQTVYIGEEIPPVSKTVLRSPDQKLTNQQILAQDREQQIPYTVDSLSMDAYESLGLENLLKLRGIEMPDGNNPDGATDPLALMNDNHKKSVEGQIKSITAAYDKVKEIVGRVAHKAEVAGVDISQMPVRYKNEYISTGRLQLSGAHNVQANKHMRHVLFSTISTVDLTDKFMMSNFYLAIGQGLGLKVNNILRQTTENSVLAMMQDGGKMAPALAVVRSWIKTKHTFSAHEVEVIQSGFESIGGFTDAGWYSLVQYARYMEASDKERKAFTSGLYVEADGVTNGPAAAMYMFGGTSILTLSHLENMARTGYFLGKPGMTLNEHRTSNDENKVDLYGVAARALVRGLKNLRSTIASQKNKKYILPYFDATQNVIQTLLPDVSFNPETGELTIGRSVTKNPLTVTVYGAGAKGISNKITKEIMDNYYMKLSGIAKAKQENPALTDDEAGAEAFFKNHSPESVEKYRAFINDFDAISRDSVFFSNEKKVYYVSDESYKGKLFSGKTVLDATITKEALGVFSHNVEMLFTSVMTDEAIVSTIGDNVTEGSKLITEATNIPSVFLTYEFRKAFQEVKDKGVFYKGSGLSQDQVNEILRKLRKTFPMVKTLNQVFDISKVAEVDSTSPIASSSDDKIRLYSSTYGPAPAGVAGIPYLVIGLGDGQMMMILSSDLDGPTGTLKVYDGMHMKLSSLNEDSIAANKAVWEAWNSNPFIPLIDSFATFADNYVVDWDAVTTDSFLVNALGLKDPITGEISGMKVAALKDKVGTNANSSEIQQALIYSAARTEAQHNVLQRYEASIDQMASVGAPYQHPGKSVSAIDQAFVNQLNEEIRLETAKTLLDILDKTSSSKKEEAAPVDDTVEYASDLLTELANDEATPSGLKLLSKLLVQSELLTGYTIKRVNSSELSEEGSTVYGATSVKDKIIYLATDALDTALHEAIHAATFQILSDFYSGVSAKNEIVATAVANLEKLMKQFMNMKDSGLDTDFADAQATINKYSGTSAKDKASALNEFMAWALTNGQIKSKLSKEKLPVLKAIVKRITGYIKDLLWGGGRVRVPQNFLDGILFNTAAVIQEGSPASGTMEEYLFHSTANLGLLNNDARLEAISLYFANTMDKYLKEDTMDSFKHVPFSPAYLKNVKDYTESLSLATQASTLASSVLTGMSIKERSLIASIVQVFAVGAKMDGNILPKAQDFYAHVIKNTTFEDFLLVDPTKATPAEMQEAHEIYKLLTGGFALKNDAQGRSAILPLFLALSLTSPRVRDVLAKVSMPAKYKKDFSSTDAALQTIGIMGMDAISDKLAENPSKESNIAAALDSLLNSLAQNAVETDSALSLVADKYDSTKDKLNDKIVDILGSVSTKLMTQASALEKATNSRLIKSLAKIGEIGSAMISEKNSEGLAEGFVSRYINRTDSMLSLRELMTDFIGRTATNAGIYDLVKFIRATVQQDRQHFREELPVVIMRSFGRKLTEKQWSNLHKGFGKTDLSVFVGDKTSQQVLDMVTDEKLIDAEIASLESQIKTNVPNIWPVIQSKSKQLANKMITGRDGNNLLKNAKSISIIVGRKTNEKQIDKLVTLYALKLLDKSTMDTISELNKLEQEGLVYVLSYLSGLRKDDKSVMSGVSSMNAYKGYIPSLNSSNVSILIAEDVKYAELIGQSYVRISDYTPAGNRVGTSKGVYFLNAPARAAYSQGLIQNVRHTVGGVDTITGYSDHPVAARITDESLFPSLIKEMNTEKGDINNLVPIYRTDGTILAFERSIDPTILAKLEPDTHLAKMIGVWRGRQVEEAKARQVNALVVDRLYTAYSKDIAADPNSENEYVNLFESKDPIHMDAMRIMPKELKEHIEYVFGDGRFMVSRSMINNAIGYRTPSVGDVWTRTSRWSPEALNTAKKIAISIYGNKAYETFVNAEEILKNVISEAKLIIVVKSVIVPVGNIVSNVLQLMARGVPLRKIVLSFPKKLEEINYYVKNRTRKIEAEAELRVAIGNNDSKAKIKLETELKTIEDSFTRLSIWPLIKAGEFSAVSDLGISREDALLTNGKLHEFIENQVDKLPDGMRTLGKYGLITKDTALFHGMQRAVEYGDFLAKAIRYDDLKERHKKTKEEALAGITEEFVNYDLLPGRFREYGENIGLWWFTAFKIRSTKIALSMIRNNPLETLLSFLVPVPNFIGAGSPVSDNLFSKIAEGNLGYSIGLGQALRAPMLNPWVNLTN